jgi:hypothetical protein
MATTEANKLLQADLIRKATSDILKTIRDNADTARIVFGAPSEERTLFIKQLAVAGASAALIHLAMFIHITQRNKEKFIDERDLAEAIGYAISYHYLIMDNEMDHDNHEFKADDAIELTGKISEALLKILPEKRFNI